MLYFSSSYKLWPIKCDENVKSQVTTKRKNIKYISITWVELCEEKIFHGKIRKNLNNVDISWDEKTEYIYIYLLYYVLYIYNILYNLYIIHNIINIFIILFKYLYLMTFK